MAAVIRKQDRHAESRSVVNAFASTAAGALAGILAAAVALGVAELAAAIIGPDSAPVIAVGETAINLTPIPVKDFAITHFGSHDKQVLVAGILVMLAGFAALIGVLAVRRTGYVHPLRINIGFVAREESAPLVAAANRVIDAARASGDLQRWTEASGATWIAPAEPDVGGPIGLPDLMRE